MRLRFTNQIGRQILGTASVLTALPRTSEALGTVAQLAALGCAPLAAAGRLRRALAAPAECLGAIGTLIARHNAQRETDAPPIAEHAAPAPVAADCPRKPSARRRRFRHTLH